MNVLEKILEEMLNYERVVKTDEDLEWNRAMYRCSEIIRSHMVEKEKVSSAEIVSHEIDGKPYYEIKYKKVGNGEYHIGYGSYDLKNVVKWLNECFEFCGEAKVSIGYGKNTNVPSNDGWIPVEERLPEEHNSMFAKFKSTPNWSNAMFEKMSDEVNVTIELEDGTRKTTTSYTLDDKWKVEKEQRVVKKKVIAWQPLPEPYKGEEN